MIPVSKLAKPSQAAAKSEFDVELESKLARRLAMGDTKFVALREVLPAAPARGDFDVRMVLDSQYFFS